MRGMTCEGDDPCGGMTREGMARGVTRNGMIDLDEEHGPCATEGDRLGISRARKGSDECDVSHQ